MFTAEPARKKAYSSDLRWRIVYQRIARNLTFEKIAKNLIYTQFHRTGGIEVTQQASEHNLRRLTDRAELYVVGLVLANPPLYLSEMCQSVKSTFDIEVSPSTICRLLQRYGLKKKASRITTMRCTTRNIHVSDFHVSAEYVCMAR